MKARLPPKARAAKITETQEHLAIAAYFKKVGLGGNAVAFHIRNERHGNHQRMLAARMGVMKGLPDWMVIDDRPGFFEIKPRGWKARKARTGNYTAHEAAQIMMHKRLRQAGAWVEICETLEEVLEALARHGVPLRQESLSTERIQRGFEDAAGVTAPAERSA